MTLNLLLGIGGARVRLRLSGPAETQAIEQVRSCYGEMTVLEPDASVAAEIDVQLDVDGLGRIASSVSHDLPVEVPEHLMPQIDEQIVIAAQHALPGLFFVHAAVLEHGGKAVLLVAESGSGKSTTCLGLVQHGFGFLSDELAPIHLESLVVESFPRALCLKATPPPGYGHEMVAFRQRLYTPIPCAAPRLPLGALVFVDYDPHRAAPEVDAISPAEAATRLAAQSLNLLAHQDFGLDALAQIAEAVPALRLGSADLGRTCRLLEQRLGSLNQL